MTQFTFNLAPERKTWTVTELTARIRDLLAGEFTGIRVEGEISNFKQAQSKHIYFTLKDAKAQIRCVCFYNHARLLKFRPEDGLHVTVRGSVSVYEARGEYQIYVEQIEPVGLGALQLAFEQLKKKLAAEGLFDAARKKPLPMLPQRIGIVTSPSGAALRDFLRILRKRFPNVHVVIYPVRVQGDAAKKDIVEALKYLNRKPVGGGVDVIILARGGGSLEDLWAFNEEIVARAIAESNIPIISAIGHETDFTIADFVADVRASTPSNAAEIVVRARQEFLAQIAGFEQQLVQHMRYRLLEWRHQVQELATHPGFRRLEDLLHQGQQRLDEITTRMAELLLRRIQRVRQRFTVAQTRIAAFDLRGRIPPLRLRLEQRESDLRARMERLLTAQRQRLDRLMLQLDERSPLRVLERGYAIVTDAGGAVVRDAAQVALGDEIALQLHRGRLAAEVKSKK
ncbi:MAG: exodeoxyribonuclease VII large subunit [Acidobacteria bacterium]|nr:exodeoxyribonuclease VII large subunit [Acidobacteriota bacterium]MBI3664010.1 exodeoxyribonuclease VII large subunit [Acidobacteriota bacterium]